MTRTHTLLLFLLFILASCHHQDDKRLMHADSLMESHPDSALVLLKKMEGAMRNETEQNRMYYRLLCIKANDKSYIRHTTDSLILPVLNYYMEQNDAHLPEAYYYAGRVYRDLEDAPQALDYFQKAIEALPKGDMNRLRGTIYSQMGTLFTYQGIHKEALEMYKMAYHCDSVLRDSCNLIYDLRDIAYEYRCNEKKDSALLYYRQAYDLARATNNKGLANMVHSQMAGLYLEQGNVTLAKKCLQTSLDTVKISRKSGIYSIAAEIHIRSGNPDSASYYYHELLQCGTVYAKKEAYHGLAKMALKENMPEKAIHYLNSYEDCLDSIQRITAVEAVQRMQSLYNYQLRVKENDRLKAENKQKQTANIYITLIAILVVVSISIIYKQYGKRKKAEYEIILARLKQIKEEQYQKSLLFIEDNKKKIAVLEQQLFETDQKNSTLLTQLQKQKEIILLSNKQAEIEWDKQEMAKAAFLKSDIYLYFVALARSTASKGGTIKKGQEWNLLEQAINSAYPGFSDNLRGIYKFSEYEWHLCLLIKSGFTPTEMAVITAHSNESITATRRRLHEKAFCRKGSPKDWDKFILSL